MNKLITILSILIGAWVFTEFDNEKDFIKFMNSLPRYTADSSKLFINSCVKTKFIENSNPNTMGDIEYSHYTNYKLLYYNNDTK